ncbi:MAG: hypothetical protein GX335_10370 [Firmicutes bacterium]|nr:hypothetical protein [Bacillota bacterium]
MEAHECPWAVCGFNIRIGTSPVGLEASHIKWRQFSGPDLEINGLALCSLHHRLFDRGAFTCFPSCLRGKGFSGMANALP